MPHTPDDAELAHQKSARRMQFVPKEQQAISELSTPTSTRNALEHLKAPDGHPTSTFCLRKGFAPSCQPVLYPPQTSSSHHGKPSRAFP